METINFKEKYNKIIATGLLLPKDKISRNGILYDWDSAKNTVNKIIGLPASYNHKIEDLSKPVGHYTDAIALEKRPTSGKWKEIWDKTAEELGHEQPGLYYEMDINPNSEYADSITRRDVRKVSIQVIPSDQVKENDDDGNSYTRAYIKDWVEAAVVPSPGFMETTMQVLAESFNVKKMNVAKESLKENQAVINILHDIENKSITARDGYVRLKKFLKEMKEMEDIKENHMTIGDIVKIGGKNMKITDELEDGYKIGYVEEEQMSTTTNPGATVTKMADKKEESKNGPSDKEVNDMAWKLYKQHWNGLSSEQQDNIFRKLGYEESYSEKFKVGDIVSIVKGFNKGKSGKVVKVHPDRGAGTPVEVEVDNIITTYEGEVQLRKKESYSEKFNNLEEEFKMKEYISKEAYETDMNKLVTILEKLKEQVDELEESEDEEKKESADEEEIVENVTEETEDEEKKEESTETPTDEDAANKNMENVDDEEKKENADTPQDEDAANKNMENVDEEVKKESEVDGEELEESEEDEDEPTPPIEEKLNLNDITSNKKENLHTHLKGLF